MLSDQVCRAQWLRGNSLDLDSVVDLDQRVRVADAVAVKLATLKKEKRTSRMRSRFDCS